MNSSTIIPSKFFEKSLLANSNSLSKLKHAALRSGQDVLINNLIPLTLISNVFFIENKLKK